jgi:hypothetical protein
MQGVLSWGNFPRNGRAPPPAVQGVLNLRVLKVFVTLEGRVHHAVCQRLLDSGSWFGNLVLPKFADANKRCMPPKLWRLPTSVFHHLRANTVNRVTNESFYPAAIDRRGGAGERAVSTVTWGTPNIFFPLSRGRSLR